MGFGAFEVKAGGSLSAVAADVARTLKRQAPGASVKVRAFTAQVEDSIRREILMAQLAGFFGIVALLLAAVGMYGLLAYAASQRTAEVGIRIALGADARAVIGMMLSQGLRPVAAGILIGLPVAWWACRFVSALLYGMKPFDAISVAAAAAMLMAVALAAAFLPARRAARVDPMTALRQD